MKPGDKIKYVGQFGISDDPVVYYVEEIKDNGWISLYWYTRGTKMRSGTSYDPSDFRPVKVSNKERVAERRKLNGI